MAPEGGREIWTNAFSERDGMSVYESSTYWETPLNDRTSLVAAPWVEQNYDTPDGWRGEATAGVKRVLSRSDNAVVALQGGVYWRSHPEPNCSEGGAEARVLAGRNLGERTFVNLEVAQRVLSGGCAAPKIDLTIGFRPARNWLAMGELFFEGRDEAARAQFSLARFGDEGRGLQIGFRARLDGDDPEPALVVAFWGRPGGD